MLKSGAWQCIATFIINMVRSMKAQKICYKREEIQSIKALTEISGMIYLQKKHFKTALTNILILWLNFILVWLNIVRNCRKIDEWTWRLTLWNIERDKKLNYA